MFDYAERAWKRSSHSFQKYKSFQRPSQCFQFLVRCRFTQRRLKNIFFASSFFPLKKLFTQFPSPFSNLISTLNAFSQNRSHFMWWTHSNCLSTFAAFFFISKLRTEKKPQSFKNFYSTSSNKQNYMLIWRIRYSRIASHRGIHTNTYTRKKKMQQLYRILLRCAALIRYLKDNPIWNCN